MSRTIFQMLSVPLDHALSPQFIVAASGFIFFFFLALSLLLLLIASGSIGWAIWLAISAVLTLFQLIFSFYNGVRIVLDLFVLAIIKLYMRLKSQIAAVVNQGDKYRLVKELRLALSYREWVAVSKKLDHLEGNDEWIVSADGLPSHDVLKRTVDKLEVLRSCGNFTDLMYELPGIIKRNHLGIDDSDVHSRCFTEIKKVILDFVNEVLNCLEYIRSLPSTRLSHEAKLDFFQKLSRNLGHTALCLSGGGSLSMYHMGVIRALIESGNYKNVSIYRPAFVRTNLLFMYTAFYMTAC